MVACLVFGSIAQLEKESFDATRPTQNLEETERTTLQEKEVAGFLEDCGFVKAGNRWGAEEVSLRVLSRSKFEIIEESFGSEP